MPGLSQLWPTLLVLLALLLLLIFGGTASAQDQVVYHIDDATTQATKGLRNIRNHLDIAPDTRIIVVTHGNGIDFLLEGAKDAKDSRVDFGSLVGALKARGVSFEVCTITLATRNLKKEQFNFDVTFTPSGVARIGQLQSREHFAYIKP